MSEQELGKFPTEKDDISFRRHMGNDIFLLNFRFTAWPSEALRSVARHFLDAVDVEEKTKAGIVDICVDMQQTARDMTERYRNEMGRYYYITPTSYLELINTFKVIVW